MLRTIWVASVVLLLPVVNITAQAADYRAWYDETHTIQGSGAKARMTHLWNVPRGSESARVRAMLDASCVQGQLLLGVRFGTAVPIFGRGQDSDAILLSWHVDGAAPVVLTGRGYTAPSGTLVAIEDQPTVVAMLRRLRTATRLRLTTARASATSFDFVFPSNTRSHLDRILMSCNEAPAPRR